MNMEFKRKMPSPQEVKDMYSVTEEMTARKSKTTKRSETFSPARITGSCSS